MNMYYYIRDMIKNGEWHVGCEDWEGKPRFEIVNEYYDGRHFVIHLWKFYLEVNYF